MWCGQVPDDMRVLPHYTFLYGDNVSAGIPNTRDSNADCAVEIITGEQETRAIRRTAASFLALPKSSFGVKIGAFVPARWVTNSDNRDSKNADST